MNETPFLVTGIYAVTVPVDTSGHSFLIDGNRVGVDTVFSRLRPIYGSTF